MRHAKSLRKFSRTSAHRKAMFCNLATSLLEHGRIETTVQKAKDLRRVVEKLVALAAEDTLAHRRSAYGYLKNKAVVHKLFAEIGPRYRSRAGGYTRIVRTKQRAGDSADMGQIQLVVDEDHGSQKSAGETGASKSKKLQTVKGEVAEK